MTASVPIEVYELIMQAPKGYRPSDWPDRLMNFDEVAELGVDLVYTKYLSAAKALAVRAELVDPNAPGYKDRFAVWSQIMKFAVENDFTLLMDPRLESADPRIFGIATKDLRDYGVKVKTASPK
jgi:uncharacterized protein DUF3579